MTTTTHSALLARLERTAYYGLMEARDARREGNHLRAAQCESYVCLLEECAHEIRKLLRDRAEGVSLLLAAECLLEEEPERRSDQ
jgi:hypothetical protein